MTLQFNKEPSLKLKREAFDFQNQAVHALADLHYAAVFHEQGLGKTKIAIDLVTTWLSGGHVDTVVIVAKKSLVHNWVQELGFHTELRPLILTSDRVSNFHVFNSPARLILTHYEAVRSESRRFALFLKTRKVGVVLDESTKIKNPNSSLTKVFLGLAPQFVRRLILTGTPVANRPYDIWSQIFFLDGGASLGDDFNDFRSKTDLTNRLSADPSSSETLESELAKVFQRISRFSVRKTKDSGVIQLPDKQHHTVITDWEARQLDLYRQVQEEQRAIVFSEGRPKLDEADAVLKRLLRLVQVASYPGLVDDSYRSEPGKFRDLLDLLVEIQSQREKAIVWTTFVDTSEWLRLRLAEFGAVRVNGRMAMDARNRSISRFKQDDAVRVLVATTGAAKEGLTLTEANHAIFFDRDFSLDSYLQAQDRIHRISQTKTSHVHKLVMQDSVDVWIDALIDAKRAAAALAQGDIDREEYDRIKSYEFGTILQEILENKRGAQ